MFTVQALCTLDLRACTVTCNPGNQLSDTLGKHLLGPSKKYAIILLSYPNMKQTNKQTNYFNYLNQRRLYFLMTLDLAYSRITESLNTVHNQFESVTSTKKLQLQQQKMYGIRSLQRSFSLADYIQQHQVCFKSLLIYLGRAFFSHHIKNPSN